MKKTIAAISASVLGLGAAAAAGAAPASAAPLPACDTANDHTVDTTITDFSTADWYMSCTPQYGMGKAEFTITTDAAHPFPAGYSLTDGKQTITSSAPTQAEVAAYFGTDFWDAHNTVTGYSGAPKYLGAFMNPQETGHTATSQTYGDGTVYSNIGQSTAYRISSAGKATDPFPAACAVAGATYQEEYEVKYAPTTTTFVETLNNIKRSVTVTYTPAPLFLGLNFDVTGDANDQGGFDGSKPLCASSGSVTVQAASSVADADAWFGVSELSATNDPEVVTTLVPQPADETLPPATPNLGTFGVTTVPVLATTGVDPTAGGITAGGLLVVGATAILFGRRRRRRNASA